MRLGLQNAAQIEKFPTYLRYANRPKYFRSAGYFPDRVYQLKYYKELPFTFHLAKTSILSTHPSRIEDLVMQPIEELLSDYYQLSEEDRNRIDEYIQDHPELKPRLDEVKIWQSLFDEGCINLDETLSDEALAFFAVLEHTKHHPLPLHLQKVFHRIRSVVEAHTEQKERYQAILDRLESIEKTVNARAQFEMLTGHKLDDSDALPESRNN